MLLDFVCNLHKLCLATTKVRHLTQNIFNWDRWRRAAHDLDTQQSSQIATLLEANLHKLKSVFWFADTPMSETPMSEQQRTKRHRRIWALDIKQSAAPGLRSPLLARRGQQDPRPGRGAGAPASIVAMAFVSQRYLRLQEVFLFGDLTIQKECYVLCGWNGWKDKNAPSDVQARGCEKKVRKAKKWRCA